MNDHPGVVFYDELPDYDEQIALGREWPALIKGPFTEQSLRYLQQRNEHRIKQAQLQLGTRWVCHPDNHITRKTTS